MTVQNDHSETLKSYSHDPLCPQYDCWLEGCTVCDECDLIARVREDERKTSCAEDLHTDCPCYREGRDVADDDVTFWEPHYQAGYTHGYAAALDAAREALTEALNALPIRWTSDELFPAVLTIHRVFDSLKEKR